MADGDSHALLLQPFVEGVEPPPLGPGLAQVQTVRRGEVAEQALGLQTGELCHLCTDFCILPGALEAKAAHARIHGQVEFRGGALAQGLLAQKLRVLSAENGGPDAQSHHLGIGGGGGVAQNENGLLQARLPQLQSLAHAGHAEKGNLGLQQTGDLHCAVAVGIGLDDGHDGHPGLAPDRVKILQDGIHIDIHIGVVV